MKRLALTSMAALLSFTAPALSGSLEEAKALMERAEALRAEADILAKKAAEMVAAAEETSAGEEGQQYADAEDVAGGDANTAVAYEEDGKYFTSDDVPTFNVATDGTVDWYAFSGFRRYHAECHVCHGPDGEGSTYAPALKESAIKMDYYDFIDVVVNGRKVVGASDNSVMPAFGDNPNVMCYLDDIYVYLKARGTENLDRGRPPKKERKSAAYVEAEDACMG